MEQLEKVEPDVLPSALSLNQRQSIYSVWVISESDRSPDNNQQRMKSKEKDGVFWGRTRLLKFSQTQLGAVSQPTNEAVTHKEHFHVNSRGLIRGRVSRENMGTNSTWRHEGSALAPWCNSSSWMPLTQSTMLHLTMSHTDTCKQSKQEEPRWGHMSCGEMWWVHACAAEQTRGDTVTFYIRSLSLY